VAKARLVTSWVEAETSARRIDLAIQTTNAGSRRVAENVGYEHLGPMHSPQPVGGERIVELYRWEPANEGRGDAPRR
jgi:RimJ/RimL family protein N-acetyltransferase